MKQLDVSTGSRFDCGIFDSDVEYPNREKSSERTVVYFELEFFISCKGTSFLDNKAYKLIPQTLLVAKPGQKRSSVFNFRCYYIHYWLDPDDKYYQLLMNCPDHYYVIDPKRYVNIWEDLIYYVNVKNYDENSDIVKAKLTELFYFVNNDAKNNTPLYSKTISQHYNFKIFQSVEYIEEHYCENLSLDFLAKQLSYSKNHYQYLFRTTVGQTPQQYVQSIRIKHAKQLLNNPHLSLIEVALESGFSTQAYFCYIFKKETGITPLKYRNTLMNK